MTPERWRQIREVLEKALDLAPGERSAFLNVCRIERLPASPAAAYFQNGFFNPAGASALFVLASVPESSEIFSSCNRDEEACSSSSRYGDLNGLGYSEFIATSTVSMIYLY